MFSVSFNDQTNIVQWIVWFWHTGKEMMCTRQSVTRAKLRLPRTTVSLLVCKNNAIHYSFWHWMMNIVIVRVSLTHLPPTSIWRYIQLADRGWPLDSNNTSHISYTIHHRELVPCFFNSFWTTLPKYVPYRSVRWCCVWLNIRLEIMGQPLYVTK